MCLCTFHRLIDILFCILLLQHHSDVSKQRVFLIINVEIVFITLIDASVYFTQLYGFVTNKKTFRGRDIKNLTLLIHYFTILLLMNPRHKTLWESEAKWNPTTLLLFKIGFSFTATTHFLFLIDEILHEQAIKRTANNEVCQAVLLPRSGKCCATPALLQLQRGSRIMWNVINKYSLINEYSSLNMSKNRRHHSRNMQAVYKYL